MPFSSFKFDHFCNFRLAPFLSKKFEIWSFSPPGAKFRGSKVKKIPKLRMQ
ncbi:hypothetical protein Hanom_Chr04g00305251 [Helianthus anomalus]